MRRLVQNFMYLVSQKIRPAKNTFAHRLWYGTKINTTGTSEEEIRNILEKTFPNARIVVEDTSGGCGAMYSIVVETKDFEGLPTFKQHKAVYTALDAQIKLIHGLHVQTKVAK